MDSPLSSRAFVWFVGTLTMFGLGVISVDCVVVQLVGLRPILSVFARNDASNLGSVLIIRIRYPHLPLNQ